MKNDTADVKADVKQQEIKEMVTCRTGYLVTFYEVPSKLEIQFKISMSFLF